MLEIEYILKNINDIGDIPHSINDIGDILHSIFLLIYLPGPSLQNAFWRMKADECKLMQITDPIPAAIQCNILAKVDDPTSDRYIDKH